MFVYRKVQQVLSHRNMFQQLDHYLLDRIQMHIHYFLYLIQSRTVSCAFYIYFHYTLRCFDTLHFHDK